MKYGFFAVIVATTLVLLSLLHTRSADAVPHIVDIARHDPPLALPGVDPASLRTAALRLKEAEESLSAIQESSDDAELILSLYPERYLLALADAESARQNLLVAPTAETAQTYLRLLHHALSLGKQSLSEFAQAFESAAAQTEARRFATFGGTVSIDDMREALVGVENGFDVAADKLRVLDSCLNGFSTCPAVTPNEFPDHAPEKLFASPATHDTASLLLEALRASSKNEIVVLHESTCLASLRAPYAITAPNSFHFVGDIFLVDTSTEHPVYSLLRREYEIEHAYVNPLAFYLCPDVGKDLGNAVAAIQTADWAREQYETEIREAQLLYEVDAKSFLRNVSPTTDARPTELSLMFAYHSGGLETIVHRIASTTLSDIEIKNEGVPFHLFAPEKFLTHSAFPTLFQAYNASFGYGKPLQRDISEEDALSVLQRYARYSTLRGRVPREKLLQDIHAFFTFEKAFE